MQGEEQLIIGTGIDIAEIARFERFVKEDNQPLFRRLFTHSELDYCFARRLSAQHLALRFAAKEAFLKALGTGLRDGINWLDIEVRNDELGKPAPVSCPVRRPSISGQRRWERVTSRFLMMAALP